MTLNDRVRASSTMANSTRLRQAADGTSQEGGVEGQGAAWSTLACRLWGKATFPSVVIRDARQQGGGMGSSSQQLWRQFSLSAINQALVQPLTAEEAAFNRQSSPDLRKLPKFSVMFTPGPQNDPSQMVFLQLTNAGHLPTSFSIHLPNERCCYCA
jgi:hypothetical protein